MFIYVISCPPPSCDHDGLFSPFYPIYSNCFHTLLHLFILRINLSLTYFPTFALCYCLVLFGCSLYKPWHGRSWRSCLDLSGSPSMTGRIPCNCVGPIYSGSPSMTEAKLG